MHSLSVVIITFNEEHNIGRCLDSVKSIADEIIVLDSFSTDNTVEISKNKGAIVKQQKFLGYIQQKNAALSFASNDYVLCLDADEALEENLINSILHAKRTFSADAYYFNRCTNYCGRFIRNGSWYPNKKIRLFNKRVAKWGGINPHDRIELDGNDKNIQYLKGDILHYSYNTIEEHVTRNNHYSSISADALNSMGVRSNWIKILFNPFWAFVYGYIIRLGFVDGFYGFIIAVNSAHATFQKYVKLYHMQHNSL